MRNTICLFEGLKAESTTCPSHPEQSWSCYRQAPGTPSQPIPRLSWKQEPLHSSGCCCCQSEQAENGPFRCCRLEPFRCLLGPFFGGVRLRVQGPRPTCCCPMKRCLTPSAKHVRQLAVDEQTFIGWIDTYLPCHGLCSPETVRALTGRIHNENLIW